MYLSNTSEDISVKDLYLKLACIIRLFPRFDTASLRRSFRLRKDRQGSPAEAHTPDANHPEFLIYEEVTQYLVRPGERPRLIVLIGKITKACYNNGAGTEVKRGWRLHEEMSVL